LDRHRNIAMSSHEDDRNSDVRLGELGLEIEATQPRQAHVEYETARHIRQLGFKQVCRRSEQLDLVSNRAEQASQRFAHELIVVDNKDDRLLGGCDGSIHGVSTAQDGCLVDISQLHAPGTRFNRAEVALASHWIESTLLEPG